MGVRIRKDVGSAMCDDDATFATSVAWQTRVAVRVQVAGHNLVTEGEAGSLPRVPCDWFSGAKNVQQPFGACGILAPRHMEIGILRELAHSCVDFFWLK